MDHQISRKFLQQEKLPEHLVLDFLVRQLKVSLNVKIADISGFLLAGIQYSHLEDNNINVGLGVCINTNIITNFLPQ